MGSHFKTPESERAYTAFIQEAMEAWPVPYDEIMVSSRFGTTHVVACGPKEAPPLVLLHGFFTTLFLWTPNIADLSQSYRVYAIDIMGNRNRSIPSEAIGTEDEIIEWLGGTLTEMGLESVYLAGMSFGGWLAIKFALAEPNRVRKLVLISPAASLQPLVKQFMPRVMLTMLPPKRYWFRMLMGWMGVRGSVDSEFSQQLLDLMWLGAEHINMSAETMRVMPTVISDTQLGALSMPVLLLIGENEVIYDSQKALARAQQLIPDIKGELVPHCGHDISFNQHRIVDGRILTFFVTDL
jgi:pimeloyl-ACP methyl ester carboxylesterase